MSNKIDGYSAVPALSPTPAGRVASGKGNQPAAPVAGIPAPDKVALTADAQSLHKLEQTISALPVVDPDRVEKIRAQLREGTYPINPQAIADQLARMEWELAR